jgi:translation initiation factor IF-2
VRRTARERRERLGVHLRGPGRPGAPGGIRVSRTARRGDDHRGGRHRGAGALHILLLPQGYQESPHSAPSLLGLLLLSAQHVKAARGPALRPRRLTANAPPAVPADMVDDPVAAERPQAVRADRLRPAHLAAGAPEPATAHLHPGRIIHVGSPGAPPVPLPRRASRARRPRVAGTGTPPAEEAAPRAGSVPGGGTPAGGTEPGRDQAAQPAHWRGSTGPGGAGGAPAGSGRAAPRRPGQSPAERGRAGPRPGRARPRAPGAPGPGGRPGTGAG